MSPKPIPLALRMDHVAYAIRDIVLAARKVEKSGMPMHWFNIGDPNRFDFAPPPWVTDAIKGALDDSRLTGYAPSEGDPELREVLAKQEGVGTDSIFVTSGLSEGLSFVFQCLLNPGDNFLLPSPSYPLYTTISRVLGGLDTEYLTDAQWQPDIDDLRKKISKKTKAVVLISPNNPTGAVYSNSTVKSILDLAGEHRLPVVADEIYDQLVFEGSHQPIYKLAGDVPVIRGNGISKNYFYPGARVGYLALHGPGLENVQNGLTRLCNARLSVNWEMQKGALAAFSHAPSHLPAALSKLKRRGQLMARRLNEIEGVSTTVPQAAFYIFPKVEKGPWKTDTEFVLDLLQSTGIVSVPGSGFSPILRARHFRMVFLPKEDEIGQAMDKLDAFMKKRTG